KYREHLESLPQSHINQLRNTIQLKCDEAGLMEPGFFNLTVPTGGGKTIASVIWALRHAITFHKKRIIIAIPFTSIIVQTAKILREIFGVENVIEHHSAVNVESSTAENSISSQLACENWDAPIVVTTNVQLFESIFSNRPSACRKLHSIVDSIVILDEVQSIPLTFMQPIINALRGYVKIFGTSFLFCTASQPVLDGQHKGCNGATLNGIDKTIIRNIIDNELLLHDQLRRVKINIENRLHSYESLATEIERHKRVLCVVNSRKHALAIYNALSKDSDAEIFHLSRSMCSSHILATIDKIKSLLSDPEKSVRVVSTQLIEAGVDIDFPVVFRQLAGLDSILQSAGRCNREGKLKSGDTIVFQLENSQQKGYLQFATDTMKDMLSLYPDADWLSPEIMKTYYNKLYTRTPSFDKEGIVDMAGFPTSCKFEEISEKFHLIDEIGLNIIVNFGDSEKLIQQLINIGPSRQLARQLGRFSVNVSPRIFKEFRVAGLIEEPHPGFYFIPLRDQYDSAVGLKAGNEFIEQTLII
ncbi:MAG: CRISPR-associated helicase Cas3', partial [Muribaculaceae bacterium]|nr:CRISPR-associated helicase Cas3' [Muribaculaceae bacterium]